MTESSRPDVTRMAEDQTPTANPAPAASPASTASPGLGPRGPAWLALIATVVLPGLGHLLLGQPKRAALLVAPVVGLGVALGGVAVASPRRSFLVGQALSPDVLAGLGVLVAAFGVYRLLVLAATAVLAGRVAPVSGSRRMGRAAFIVVLAVLVVSPHLYLGAVIAETRATVMAIFAPDGPEGGLGGLLPPGDGVSPGPVPSVSHETPTPQPTTPSGPPPSPTPTPIPGPAWAANGRLDLLLIGADAGPYRWSLRTDTMILLSVDVATGRAAMFGFPRNMVGVPLPPETAKAVPGGRYPGLLNSLYVYANAHPDQFPGGPIRGFRAVGGAIETLAGIDLDGIAVVDLIGFVKLVDAIGGVDIKVPAPLYDDHYPLENGTGHVVAWFPAGRQHLDGHRALMYARSRHGDSDYGRMARQQAILVAIRRGLNPCTLIPRIPTLLEIARDYTWTSLAARDLPSLLELAATTDTLHITSILFAPPTYPEFVDNAEIRAIRGVVRTVFDAPPSATPTPIPTLNLDDEPTADPGPCG